MKGGQRMTTQKVVRRELPKGYKTEEHRLLGQHFIANLTTGYYEDGTCGEVRVELFGQGRWALPTSPYLVDAVFEIVSLALQYGVPLEEIIVKLRKVGKYNHDVSSLLGFVGDCLESEFLRKSPEQVIPEVVETKPATEEVPQTARRGPINDAPPCHDCGSLMVRETNQWRCRNCGAIAGLG